MASAKSSSMTMDAMIHCFLHANVLASIIWLARRAVPGKGYYAECFDTHEATNKKASPNC
eukprot:5434761-Pyramimonas_sp.AAC.1